MVKVRKTLLSLLLVYNQRGHKIFWGVLDFHLCVVLRVN
jgi:hypothetical protein